MIRISSSGYNASIPAGKTFVRRKRLRRGDGARSRRKEPSAGFSSLFRGLARLDRAPFSLEGRFDLEEVRWTGLTVTVLGS